MKAMGKGSVASFLMVLLNISYYAVLVFLFLTVCFAAVSPFVDFSGGKWELSLPVSFELDARTHRITAPSLGIERAEIEKASGTMKFPIRRGAFLTSTLIGLVVMLAVSLWVLGQLRAVFRTLRDGQPFVPANATRIRRIGWIVIIGELVGSIVSYTGSYNMMNALMAEGLRFHARPSVNLFAIVNGLIILVIAEVFRAGTRLDEEQSLTV